MKSFIMTKSKGFTLIELIVVIAIIGILAGIVMIAINPEVIINRTNDTKIRTEMNQVKTSLQLYFNDNNRYPDKDTEFDASTGSVPFVPTYMRQLPTAFTINYGTNGTNYDAWAKVNELSADDTNSRAKCTSDGDETGSVITDAYMICPD